MNLSKISSLGITLAISSCGVNPDSRTELANGPKLSAAALIHRIQPLGVNSSCFGSHARTVRDHRTTPTRTYTQYVLGIKDCSPAASSLVVQMLGGQQWVAGYSFVTIKKNGLCLTNPVSNASTGVDKGETFWQTCIAQNSSSVERYRQQWLLQFNRNNALRIESHAALRLGYANAQVQCLNRVTPHEMKRGFCNLHNWQITAGN